MIGDDVFPGIGNGLLSIGFWVLASGRDLLWLMDSRLTYIDRVGNEEPNTTGGGRSSLHTD